MKNLKLMIVAPLVFFTSSSLANTLHVTIINETGKDLGVSDITIDRKNSMQLLGCSIPNDNVKPVPNKTYVPTQNMTTRTYRCDSVNVKKWQRKITIGGVCNFQGVNGPVYAKDRISTKYPRRKEWFGRKQYQVTNTGIRYTIRVKASDCPAGSLSS